MKLHRIVLALTWLLIGQIAGAAGLQSYSADNWNALRAAHAATPWIVHLWGMSCDPCRAELAAWGRFAHGHPATGITFIEVEQATPSEVKAALARAGLANSDQWLSEGGFDDAQRYAIDRHWGGELPLTLLIAPNGQVQTITGTMNMRRLNAWLQGQKRP